MIRKFFFHFESIAKSGLDSSGAMGVKLMIVLVAVAGVNAVMIVREQQKAIQVASRSKGNLMAEQANLAAITLLKGAIAGGSGSSLSFNKSSEKFQTRGQSEVFSLVGADLKITHHSQLSNSSKDFDTIFETGNRSEVQWNEVDTMIEVLSVDGDTLVISASTTYSDSQEMAIPKETLAKIELDAGSAGGNAKEDVVAGSEDNLPFKVPGEAWIDSWNSDTYGTDCITLVEGRAVIKRSCGGKYVAICESPCGTSVVRLTQCDFDKSILHVSSDKMNNRQAYSYCQGKGLQLYKHNVQKVPRISSSAKGY